MSTAVREPSDDIKKARALTIYNLFQNAPGSLPLTSSTFQTKGGDILLVVSGSGYRQTSDGSGIVAFNISVDGKSYGTSQVCANNTEMHMATIPVTLLIQGVAAGGHTVTLDAAVGTTTDGNDFFNVTAEEHVKPGTVS